MLADQGVREITLLGQNVNSYADWSAATLDQNTNAVPSTTPPQSASPPRQEEIAKTAANMHDNDSASEFKLHYARGFRSVYRPRREGAISFAELLDRVASVDPEIRLRFTSPHPKDFSDEVLDVISSRANVCNQLHMPAQSGSSAVLDKMRRGYSREAYVDLVNHVRGRLPGVALSTDMIAGFCGETEEDHAASVDLLKSVMYDQAFLFAYSERDRTHAARHLVDDVPVVVKSRRLKELIEAFRGGLVSQGAAEVGRRHVVLVEGPSRRDPEMWTGRTDSFKRVVFDGRDVPAEYFCTGLTYGISQLQKDRIPSPHAAANTNSMYNTISMVRLKPGDYVAVQITEGGGGGTLRAVPLARTTLAEFVGQHGTALPLENFGSVDVFRV